MMSNKINLEEIRENERKSHIEMYSKEELFKEGSWLKKPVKTILDLMPYFDDYKELNVLDLGCGVGRNCIAIAQHFKKIPCIIECVDILELAIEKLYANAKECDVLSSIKGIVKPIEEYPIARDRYDLIMAVSALEHIDSKESFIKKLAEIAEGIRKNGIVCLIINSNVTEKDKATGDVLYPQFEVNLTTEELQALLNNTFSAWEIVKTTVRDQQYDIPREQGLSELKTSAVTFMARKTV